MTTLAIYDEQNPGAVIFATEAVSEITQRLEKKGVRFEQWTTNNTIKPGAPQQAVLSAYEADIKRLQSEEGYVTVDVVSLNSDAPNKEELRKKFLSEHTHSEDEVRFFVAGEGLFTLHIDDQVYEVLCKQGDLISVPANTPHWFDMGPNPNFIAIRLFNNPEGWVANYTGNDIADGFSRLEN